MKHAVRYTVGQRWEFQPPVAAFENTLVIAKVEEAYDIHERKYRVYVRYSEAAKGAIPPDYDGTVLSLTDEAMARNVTRLVATDVKLPWWWQYGRRYKSKKDAKGGTSTLSCDRVSEALEHTYESAVRTVENTRACREALAKHRAMFPPKRARPRPSKTVAESWERIERWYAEYAAPLTPSWPPGASAAAIRQFEKAIGATLPDEFKESVRIHDGGGDWWVPWREGELLSLDGILKEWRWYFEWYAKGDDAPDDEDEDDSDLDELQGPIKRVVWNQTRIPVTNNSSNHLMLDLDPPADGVYGQLIDHTRSAGPTRVVATGWGEFLRNLVADLESGRYVYLEHQGGLETVEELERDLG